MKTKNDNNIYKYKTPFGIEIVMKFETSENILSGTVYIFKENISPYMPFCFENCYIK